MSEKITKSRARLRSAEFRAKASEAISAWNRKRAALPKCGAKAKSTGEPCKRLAMANGRCCFHGGRTPKGDQWHTTVWPDGSSPAAEAKLNRKLKNMQRDARKRETRQAAMSPSQRAQHERWHTTHKPGAAAKRAKIRHQRETRADIEELLNKHQAPGAEAAALQREIDRLKALLGDTVEPTETNIFS